MVQNIDAAVFQRMVIHAHAAINAQKQTINDLNGFPVPDGDTGTNMTLTIGAAAREIKKDRYDTVGQAAQGTASARLTLDIRLPEDFTADAFDWNIILGSLLDHAVEALEKSREKRLSLSLRVDRGIFYLKMAYSDDGPAPQSEGANGLGGSLVQRAIDKYHGTLDVDHAGQICTVKVMLYLEP